MSNPLHTLSKYLFSHDLYPEFKALRGLLKRSNDIGEDWDVEEEERLLSDAPADRDKIVRDTNPHPGWFLPHEDKPRDKKEPLALGWMTEDSYGTGDESLFIDQDIITPELISALNSFGDGSEPHMIGNGAWGIVWDLGNDKYLKIYNLEVDQMKADLAREMVFEGLPYAADELMVHATGALLREDSNPRTTSSLAPPGWSRQKGWKIMEKLLNSRDLESVSIMKTNSPQEFFYTTIIIRAIKECAFQAFYSSMRLKADRRRVTPGLWPKASAYNQELDDLSDVIRLAPKEERIAKIKMMLSKPRYRELLRDAADDVYDRVLKYIDDNMYSDRIDRINKVFDLDEEWIKKLTHQMMFLILIGRDDLQIANLGVRPSSGTFVFFDA